MPSVLWRCWLGGRKGIRPVKTEWWGAGVVIRLGRGADVHMDQLMPLPLTVSCSNQSGLVLHFWCRLTQVVLDKIQDGRKMVVCVCVHARYHLNGLISSYIHSTIWSAALHLRTIINTCILLGFCDNYNFETSRVWTWMTYYSLLVKFWQQAHYGAILMQILSIALNDLRF